MEYRVVSSQTFVTQLQRINTEFSAWIKQIKADGVLTEDELLDTKPQVQKNLKELRLLKKEVNAAIRAARVQNQNFINSADGGWFTSRQDKQKMIRRELPYLLEPYKNVLVLIDEVMLNIENAKNITETELDRLKREAVALAIAPASVEDEQEDYVVSETHISIDEVTGIVSKWKRLIDTVDAKLTSGQLTPQQNAYQQGIKKALTYAIDDLSALVEES